MEIKAVSNILLNGARHGGIIIGRRTAPAVDVDLGAPKWSTQCSQLENKNSIIVGTT
jgi:hypothetical protein